MTNVMADIFDAFREKQRETFAKLQACPAVVITGIVSENGVYGMQPTEDDPITLRGSFDAWHFESGPLETIQSLSIECHVRPEQLERLIDSMRANAIVQIRAKLGHTDELSTPKALLEERIEANANDPHLQQHLDGLLNPHTIEDPLFGTFTCDRRLFLYTARSTCCNDDIELKLLPDEPVDMDAAINAAKTLWSTMADWNKRVRDYAVADLLSLKNDSWRDGREMSADEFASRLQLGSVSVCQTGSFTFNFDCGNMFGDHGVEVFGDLKRGLQGAGISG
ncbi:MAG: DUF2262 domain-containing protein [Planctomycetaceae bacterium]